MALRSLAIKLSIISAVLAALAPAANALSLFEGYDANPNNQTVLPEADRTNTSAAFFNFLQAIDNGSVTTESFEDLPTSQAIDGLSQDISGVTADFSYLKPDNSSATGGSTTKVQLANSSGMTNSGTYPTDGEKGISINSSNQFSIDFSAPLAAFGFWGTDLGDRNNQLTVELLRDGTSVGSQLIDFLGADAGDSSVFFFGGLADNPAEQFNQVRLISSAKSDAIGLDQLTIATPEQVAQAIIASTGSGTATNPNSSGDAAAIPTPALLPGLIGFGISLGRKRRSQTN